MVNGTLLILNDNLDSHDLNLESDHVNPDARVSAVNLFRTEKIFLFIGSFLWLIWSIGRSLLEDDISPDSSILFVTWK